MTLTLLEQVYYSSLRNRNNEFVKYNKELKHQKHNFLFLIFGFIGFISIGSCTKDDPVFPGPKVEAEGVLGQIHFDTEEGVPIVSKDDYVDGVLTVYGQSVHNDLIIDAKLI